MKINKIITAMAAIFLVGGTVPMMKHYAPEYIITANALVDDDGNEYTEVTSGYLTYFVYPDHAEVAFCNQEAEGDIVIPSKINGVPVTIIKNEYIKDGYGYGTFSYCRNIESVSIPNTVTEIKENTFQGCTSLSEIIIPSSVNKIGYNAFSETPWLENKRAEDPLVVVNDMVVDGSNCTGDILLPNGITSICDWAFEFNENITSVFIPDSVSYIGESAFRSCSSLKSVNIPYGITVIGNGTFWGAGIESITLPDSITEIGDYAFSGTKIKNIVIPDSVRSIRAFAFSYSELETITLPAGLRSIEHSMFSGCKNLKSFDIPYGVEEIDSLAFCGCENLESVTIPDSCTKIMDCAFLQCTKLSDINVPDTLWYIEYSAFNDTAWFDSQADGAVYIGNVLYKYKGDMPEDSSFTIREGTIGIAQDALSLQTGMTSVTFPRSLEYIGDCAFSNCTGLTSVTLPECITDLGGGIFANCSSLTAVDFKCDIKELKYHDNAGPPIGFFDYCTSLSKVDLPDSLEVIGAAAFEECTSLKSISIPENVVTIDGSAFTRSGITEITIPSSVEKINPGTFYRCKALTRIDVENGNEYFTSFNDVLYDKNMTKLICYPNGKTDTELFIPDTVSSIEYMAFSGCEYLNSVVVPESVESIGWYSFAYCTSLISVTLPDSVSIICNNAFYYCSNLEKINIPQSVKTIEYSAFEYCENLKSIILPASVEKIERGAFGDCKNLETITIANSECNLYDMGKCFCDTIYGYKNSTAQAYAEEYEYNFVPLGDSNGDTEVNIADAVMLQKFLLGNGELGDWRAADLCADEKIDVFDMLFMRKLLIGAKNS